MGWIDLSQDMDHGNMVMSPRIPLNVWKFLSGVETSSLSRRVQLHGVT
jgi:hypothetical protein